MIIVGMLMAIANGTVNPLMCIVFGEMTDSFIEDARLSKNHNISNPSECSSACNNNHINNNNNDNNLGVLPKGQTAP